MSFLNSKYVATCVLTSACLLTACSNDNNDDSSSVVPGQSTLQTQLSYSADLVNDSLRKIMFATGLVEASSATAKVQLREESYLDQGTGSSAQGEVDLRMTYQAPGNAGSTNRFVVVARILDNGIELKARARLSLCLDQTCSNEADLQLEDTFTGDANDPVTLSISWDASNEVFTYGANTQTASISMADLLALPAIPAGTTFDINDFRDLAISATIKNIAVPGDAANINLGIDEVSADGAVYDDFNDSDQIDPSKWDVQTNAF